MRKITDSEKKLYLDTLMKEYADLRNPTAERQFFNNNTFRSEIKFEPDEKILYLNYQNLKYVLIKSVLPVIFVVIFSFLAYGGYQKLSEELFGEVPSFLLFIGLTIVLIVGFTLIKQYLQSKSYRYIITDRRIIVGYTFLQRWVRAVEFSNIVDIVVHQSLIARPFNAGNVMLITGSYEGVYVGGGTGVKGTMLIRGFMNVPDPFRIKNLIKGLMSLYSENQAQIPDLLVKPLDSPAIQHKEEIGLKPEEHIFKVYEKKQSSSLIKGLIGWLVIPFYLLFSFGDISFILELGSNFLRLIGIILLIGIVVIIVFSKSHARGFEFVITDKRIIMFKKFLSISIRDVIMGKITDVSIFQQAVGRVANYGLIQIGTKGFERLIKFKDLYHIQGVANVPVEKDDIRNLVLYFQRGQLYNPLIEMYDPEFLNI